MTSVSVHGGRDLEGRAVHVLFLCMVRTHVLANVQEGIVAMFRKVL